jgi:glutathione-regulated potassium-efflux system protein KefB
MCYWQFFTSSWSLALLLGLVLANSSTALVIQILERKQELDQEHGRAAFAVLLFQDLTVMPIIALVPLFAETLLKWIGASYDTPDHRSSSSVQHPFNR